MSIDTAKLVDQMIEEVGINPMLTYCSVTGRAIGTIHAETFMDIIDAIDDTDEEIIFDELLSRTLHSMRPSPVWNEFDESTLRRFVKSRPHEVLAYCLNRLYEPSDKLKVGTLRRLDFYHERIRRFNIINELHKSGADFSAWLYMLIEVDAKYNLTTLPIPDIDLYSSMQDFSAHLELWKKWYFPLKESYEKRIKEELRADRWLKGNTLAKSAHFNMFMESKPPTKTAIEKQKKKDELDFFANIFSEVMREKADVEVRAESLKPKISATTTLPKRFGGLKKAGG